MKVKSISFKNYKAFFEQQTMQLKPITILIGKNSSGKSSIAKLFPLLENSLMGDINEPLLLKNSGVELAEEFDNLFFDNNPGGIPLSLNIVFEDYVQIEIGLLKKVEGYGLNIFQCKYKSHTQEFDLELLELNGDEYVDVIKGKTYKCKFKGFIPSQIIEKNTNNNLSENLQVDTIDVDYIGLFRILPERYFYLHKQHLVNIVVGFDESKKEIHPKSVLNIIIERSKIIVENGINDWNFIMGICQKYSGAKKMKKMMLSLKIS
jgi:AAA15 family ATPase/GTPase